MRDSAACSRMASLEAAALTASKARSVARADLSGAGTRVGDNGLSGLVKLCGLVRSGAVYARCDNCNGLGTGL